MSGVLFVAPNARDDFTSRVGHTLHSAYTVKAKHNS